VATRGRRRRLPAASAERTGSLNDRCSLAAAMGRDGLAWGAGRDDAVGRQRR
jgi:hypothetical protein